LWLGSCSLLQPLRQRRAALRRIVLQHNEGHACVFIDCQRQLHFEFSEQNKKGGCNVASSSKHIDLEPVLASLMPEIIARPNFGQEIEFRDRNGKHASLWHDPKARRICTATLDPAQPPGKAKSIPIFCPRCTAVLRIWREGEENRHARSAARFSLCLECSICRLRNSLKVPMSRLGKQKGLRPF
jgi:hypothetical protein